MKNTFLVLVVLVLACSAGLPMTASAQTANENADAIKEWQTYHSPIARFTVDFPHKPVRTWRSLIGTNSMVDYAVTGYAVERSDREWIVLFLKGAPNGYFDNETKIGGYRAQFNADTLAGWPRGYANVHERRKEMFQGKWQANHYIVTADDGFRSEFYTFVIDDTLYYLEFGHSALAVQGPALKTNRDWFFNSFNVSGEDTPAGASGM